MSAPEKRPRSTAAERRLNAQVAIHTRWAQTVDRSAATAAARTAFDARFEPDDPDGRLSPEQRAAMAESARKAYFADLARKSAKAKRRAAQARRGQAEALRAERDVRIGRTEPSGGAA